MTTLSIQHHYGVNPLCRCDNCEHNQRFDSLEPIKDIQERLMAGCETPAGECSDCGSLSYIVNDDHVIPRRHES